MEYNKNKHTQGKENWNTGLDSPAQQKKSDWRLPRQSFAAEERARVPPVKSTFAAGGTNSPATTKAKGYHHDGMQPNRSKEFGDLDSLLSEAASISSKKEYG